MTETPERPLLIVGASRSGTTLLRLMLNAHPRIAVPHEFKYFADVSSYAKPGVWKTPLDEPAFEKLVDRFLAKRDHVFGDVGIEKVRDKILSSPDRTIAGPYKVAVREWMLHYGKSRWGEKTPYHLYYVDTLNEMFPEAYYVYMLRDPRAVVTSMNGIEYFSNDTLLNALNWNRAATIGFRGLVQAVPEDRRIVVRYEDLAIDPAKTLTRICSFIGEEFTDDMLSFYQDSSKYMNPVIRTENVKKAVTNTSVDKWKNILSESEVRAIESICGPAMTVHGYKRSAATPTLFEKAHIAVKKQFFNSKIRKHADFPGYTVTYPMFARFRKDRQIKKSQS